MLDNHFRQRQGDDDHHKRRDYTRGRAFAQQCLYNGNLSSVSMVCAYLDPVYADEVEE